MRGKTSGSCVRGQSAAANAPDGIINDAAESATNEITNNACGSVNDDMC